MPEANVQTNPEPDNKIFKEYAFLLEKNDYGFVDAKMKEWEKNDPLEFFRFRYYLLHLYIHGEISRQKIELADYLAAESKISIAAEDRTRIVFLLASCINLDLVAVNNKLKKEFGPYFILKDHYGTNEKPVTWKKVIERASEIKNGYLNHAYLMVSKEVSELIDYYKMSSIQDIQTLEKIDSMTDAIIAELKQKYLITLAILNGQDKSLLNQIVELYRLTGRLGLDITRLQENPDTETIFRFIAFEKTIAKVKIELLQRNMPLDDFESIHTHFMDILGKNEFESYVSKEEIARTGIPLSRAV